MTGNDDHEHKTRSKKAGEQTLAGGHKTSDTAKTAEENVKDAIEVLTTLVRKYPIESVAVGFGVGCLVALVLTQRR